MPHVRYLLYSLCIILFATACSPESEDFVPPDVSSFSFSIDPQNQTVSLNEASTASLSPQQTSEEPRVLDNDTELSLQNFQFRFLPGNLVRIEGRFRNNSIYNFEQPFSFEVAPGTLNVVRSVEPSVSDADLGGDGVLSPGEKTALLIFEVEHRNEPLKYFVNATAKVSEFNNTCDDPNAIANIPDENLQDAIRSTLGLASAPKCQDMLRLTVLESIDTKSLEGLQFATNLQSLNVFGDVSDLSPLANLMELRSLNFSRNQVSDLSPLANLTSLTSLNFEFNKLSDLSPLANLTSLTSLDFGVNRTISDLSPLANLPNLTRLELDANEISDISVLANLNSLTTLNLSGNNISDLSPLANLTTLTDLDFRFNTLGNPLPLDLSPLAGLTGLTRLNIRGNEIRDLSPIAALTELIILDLDNVGLSDISVLADPAFDSIRDLILSNNRITDISPLVANPNLGKRLVDLKFNCLDLSSGSEDTVNIQILEDRNPDRQNVFVSSKSPCIR